MAVMDYNLNVEIDDEHIIVTWKKVPPELAIFSELTPQFREEITRYPQLSIQINYRDIASDTVREMLRDLEIPDSMSKAIMAQIATPAN